MDTLPLDIQDEINKRKKELERRDSIKKELIAEIPRAAFQFWDDYNAFGDEDEWEYVEYLEVLYDQYKGTPVYYEQLNKNFMKSLVRRIAVEAYCFWVIRKNTSPEYVEFLEDIEQRCDTTEYPLSRLKAILKPANGWCR